MIGYLRGRIIDKNLNSVIVLSGQVGYEVSLPAGLLSRISKDTEVEFWIYSHVREDAFLLFGFEDKESLDFFKQLLSVSGIGPKVALAIVSSAPISKLKVSISQGDPSLISAVSGVGRKTAEKAVVELRGKIGIVPADGQIFSNEGGDIMDALVSLGFSRQEASQAISDLPENIDSTDEKIKLALKKLGNRSTRSGS